MKYSHRVLALLSALAVITYLDRVCISVAGPRIQSEFGLGPEEWGVVTGAFATAYALFELPSGYLADRFGARAMLTRIVVWWSLFTGLTASASQLWSWVAIRFLFGAGEAGAFPTMATAVSRWFAPLEQGRAFGVVLLSGQAGAAIAPLVIVPLQIHFGWRAAFYLFAFLGVVWSLCWWRWYRNRPAEQAGISARELADIGPSAEPSAAGLPWRAIGSNVSVWALMGATFGYLYAYYFFLFWLPTYLIRERGFSERQTLLSALPFLLGMATNYCGGFARDAAARRWGPTWGPRSIGVGGLGLASVSAGAALASTSGGAALGWLALCYGGITLQQPSIFTTCADIGRRHTGAVTGCMNTAGALGGLSSSFAFGYLVHRFHTYDVVLRSMAVVLLAAAGLWLMIDPMERLEADATPS